MEILYLYWTLHKLYINNGTINFDYYKKSAKKPIFINYHSALPVRSKINFVRNEKKRILDRCSTEVQKKTASQHFSNILELNDYPKQLNYATSGANRLQRNEFKNEDMSYLKIPFVSDDIDDRVSVIFQELNLPVRITHNSYTMRDALTRKRRNDTQCHWKSCLNTEKEICLKEMTVYRIICMNCQKFYIGSTIRKLHTRVTEHLKTRSSSVFQHVKICQPGIDHPRISTTILAQDRDPINLRFREAMEIKKAHPSINNKNEMSDYQHLIF